MSTAPEGGVELPRRDLAPRRWRMPNGEIVGEAANWEAVELLKSDPAEYFRRTVAAVGGVTGEGSDA